MNCLIASQGAGPDLAVIRASSYLVLPGWDEVATAFGQVIALAADPLKALSDIEKPSR